MDSPYWGEHAVLRLQALKAKEVALETIRMALSAADEFLGRADALAETADRGAEERYNNLKEAQLRDIRRGMKKRV
jgi:hypothetical protein